MKNFGILPDISISLAVPELKGDAGVRPIKQCLELCSFLCVRTMLAKH